MRLKLHFNFLFSFCFVHPAATDNASKSSISNAKTASSNDSAILNEDEDDEIIIYGYQRSTTKTFITWLAFILSAGLLRLFMHWRRHWLLLATHSPCGLDIAKKLLIRERFEGKHTLHYVKDVVTLNAENVQKTRQNRFKKNEFMAFDNCDVDEKNFQLSVHLSDGIFQSNFC